jgi:large subunit ribosomal protein L33
MGVGSGDVSERHSIRLIPSVHHLHDMPRDKIILACSDCKNRNYFTTKNRRLHPERVEWKKYCPRCNKHVVHKETK